MKITVNGNRLDFFGSQIGYAEVVKLADMSGSPSVTYQGPRAGDTRRSGTMRPGCMPVELDDGMVFNVAHTDRA